jgi:hypothetical protein
MVMCAALDPFPVKLNHRRHCEEPEGATRQSGISRALAAGLLRFARNDESISPDFALDLLRERDRTQNRVPLLLIAL